MNELDVRVYELTKMIPRGKVTTYGALAEAAGKPRAARFIGRLMATNPTPIVVPCHRVVKSDGSLGGYTGEGGVTTKVRLLTSEGVRVVNGKVGKTFFFEDFPRGAV